MARAEQGSCLWLLSLGWLEQLQKLFIFSLMYRNRDFDEKYTSAASLIRYPNIDIIYFRFLASQT
jgi:hypothetical protein